MILHYTVFHNSMLNCFMHEVIAIMNRQCCSIISSTCLLNYRDVLSKLAMA